MEVEQSRKRRRCGAELKARILAECGAPGASVAKVAMSHGINANIVHGWRKLSRRVEGTMAPGLGVSMPVDWDQLMKLKGGAHWTIVTAREHLSFQTGDPWADYWAKKQTLTAAMKTLAFKAPAKK